MLLACTPFYRYFMFRTGKDVVRALLYRSCVCVCERMHGAYTQARTLIHNPIAI